jgi:dihydrofolate reductase
MGRETYSLFEHPLPDRKNVVVSRSAHSVRDGFELVHNVDQFLRNASEDVWIIGGAALYESVLPYCQELYVTQVAGDYGCDHFFPDFIHDYSLQKSSPLHTQNGYTYQFTVYSKNR